MATIIISVIVLVFLVVIARLLYLIWQLISVRFVGKEMDEVDRKGVREEMRKIGDKDVLGYLGKDPAPSDVQKFLQYIYALNRIGGGIRKGYLSKVVFETWMPFWFTDNWKKLGPLVEQERKRRKVPNLYGNFEWLADYCAKKK